MAFKPTAASGGAANIIGLWNAYNRVPFSALCQDSAATYGYGTNTWRAKDGSTSNRVSVVDGLGQSPITASSAQAVALFSTAVASDASVGVVVDSTSATPNAVAYSYSAAALDVWLKSEENFSPALGFHYYQAMENALSGVSSNYLTTPYNGLTVAGTY